MGIKFSDTWEELTRKMIGYHHDHCHHIFIGETKDIIDEYKYKELMVNTKKYCFIYEEDKPYIPK